MIFFFLALLCLSVARVAVGAKEYPGIPLHDLGPQIDPATGEGTYLWSVDPDIDPKTIWTRHLDYTRQQWLDEHSNFRDLTSGTGFENQTFDHDNRTLVARQFSDPQFGKDGSFDAWYCERWATPHKGAGSCSWKRNFNAWGEELDNRTAVQEHIRALIYRAIDHGYPGRPKHGFHSECLYYDNGPMFCISWPPADKYYNDWGGEDWIRRYTVSHFSREFVTKVVNFVMGCYDRKSSAQMITVDERDEIFVMCFSDRHTGCDTMVCHPWFNIEPIDYTKWDWPTGDICPDGSLEDWPKCAATAPGDPDDWQTYEGELSG